MMVGGHISGLRSDGPGKCTRTSLGALCSLFVNQVIIFGGKKGRHCY